MAYIPLHHKYRPQTFADLVGQEAIATTLSNALRLQKIAPAYLFTGPRGTGKTSSARILAKSLNCMASAVPTAQPCGSCDVCRSIASGSALDIIEIDAASNTGVDNIREIIERAQYAPVQCRYKVYIIDECHMLTTAAFNSLLKTLEEPPPHVVFILATTDPQRVLPTIISRCQRFDYRRIPVAAMVGHLTYIAQTEQIEIPTASITLISQIAQGGLRDAESLLDRLSLLSGEITPDRVWDAIGSVPEQDLLEILQSIASNDPESLLDRARNILERGKEPLTVLQNLAGCYRDLLIAKTAPQRPDLVALSPETWTELSKLAQAWQISWILAGQKHLKDSEVQIKQTTQPQLWLEITLLGLLSVSTQPVAVSPVPQPVSTPAPLAPPPATSQLAPAQPSSSVAAVPIQPQPLPHEPRPASVPSSTPPPAPGNDELKATWEKVLQQLLPASKDLFKVFGTLISITTEQAVVAMKSSTMQQIASGKVPELTKVFSSMFGRSIVVKLEVLGKSQPQAAASSAPVTPVPAPVTIAPTPPAPIASIPAPVTIAPAQPAPPPEITAPAAIEPTPPELPSHPPQPTIPAPTEYLTDEEEEEEEETAPSADLVLVPPQVSTPIVPIQPQSPPIVSLQPVPSHEPPAAKLEPLVPLSAAVELELELEPPNDFDEPPDSFDVDRAAQIETTESDKVEIDPALQAATDNVVKLFNGEIIDRSHDLYAKLVGE
jgi:DNA polymerase III subunit gamma/tau